MRKNTMDVPSDNAQSVIDTLVDGLTMPDQIDLALLSDEDRVHVLDEMALFDQFEDLDDRLW